MTKAVAMHKTPWYLRIIGFKRWRVLTRQGYGDSTNFYWAYYRNLGDYSNKMDAITRRNRTTKS